MDAAGASAGASAAVDAYVDASDAWPDVIRAVRPILLGSGLVESIKWRKPCYSIDGANIAIVQEMKEHCALMFFKGALLDDPAGVLEAQGPNSRSAMRICLRSVDDVTRLSTTITDLVAAAIAVERAGLAVEPAAAPEWVDELAARIDSDARFAAAFAALTPGRQREYHLHIAAAKQSETRLRRLEACVPRILAGRGMRDRMPG